MALRVLITNNRLDWLGGAESFLADLARGLQSAGHRVLAYTTATGRDARPLDVAPVPVATDLAHLEFQPDVIHAQHHLDAMTALAYLPGVPAVYHCHGAGWRDFPPRHPRIRRYLAMSETLRERLRIEANIPGPAIEVLPNSVDLSRFRQVRTPPARPARALFYNGHHRPGSPTLETIHEATGRAGLGLDVLGFHFGKLTARPEQALLDYDIVFASGRSAIDAMACGCAVVVLGLGSCGELVRPDNFAALRAANFSVAANRPPASLAAILEQISRYDPAEVGAVTERLRREADSTLMVRRLVPLYESVIDEHRRNPADPAAEMKAMADYLRQLVPAVKLAYDNQRQQDLGLTKAVAFRELRLQLHRFQMALESEP
jgi:glycosyltransferase involved in cell wall biosynthesis